MGRLGAVHPQIRELGCAVALLDPGEPPRQLDRARVVARVAVQLHERAQRADMARVAREHLLVRGDRALQETALAEVGGEIREACRALVAVEIAAQEQPLVQPDRAADVTARAVEAREREMRLDALRVELGARHEQRLGAVVIAVEDRQQGRARRGIGIVRRCARSAPADPVEHRAQPPGRPARAEISPSSASGRLRSWCSSASSPPTALR